MLEYIKQQLAQREAERSSNNDADILQNQMDEAIVEFAHLVDGMEELTMEGHNALRERPILDIPIEDDIELDSVELSLTTNRIMDIPSDITAMEAAYSDQKTFEDFYSEAMTYVTRLPRENDSHYNERVTEKAEELFTEYNNFIIQEGLFGNDMMSINDDRVPAKVVFDFGKYDGKDYIVKLKVGFEVDAGRRVNIKQVHALTIAQNLEVFRSVAGYLKNILVNERNMRVGEVWDVAEPVRCIVPKYDGRYNVAIQFEVEGSDDVYVTWSIDESKIRKSKTGNPDMSNLGNIERPELKLSSDNVSDMNILSKGRGVSESYTESYRPKTVPSRWDLYNDNTEYIQEAIDFGGGDNSDAAPAGGNDQANITPDATGADNPPAADNGENAGATSDNAPSVDAQPAAKNDVSDAIAAKVSNDTNSDPADLGMDAAPTFDANPDVKLDLNPDNAGITTDSNDNGGNVEDLEPNMNDTSADMGKTDNFDTPTVDDSSINNDLTSDIDSSATSDEDAGVDNLSSSIDDIDNLSIDDLLAKGEDKLKGMSIAQLKDFLNDGLGDNEPTTEAAVIDNSFKRRLNVAARRCLGILNDKSRSLKQIILEFQNESKKFNVLLGQAYNTNYFEESAKENLRKCNKFLVDLRMNLKPNPSNNDKKKLVTLIKEFARNSKNVVKLCERDSAPVTMEYAMTCETDELGNIIQETVNTKIAKELLIWYLIGGVVKHDTPYGPYHFNRNFILTLLSPFTLGITGIVATIKNIIDICVLIDNGLDEMVSVELSNDIMTAYGLLTKTQDGVTLNAALNKFKSALKKIVSDSKHANDCKNTDTRSKVTNLGSKADVVLSEIKQNKQHVNEDSLKELVNAMEETLEVLVDKKKLKTEIEKLNKNKKN